MKLKKVTAQSFFGKCYLMRFLQTYLPMKHQRLQFRTDQEKELCISLPHHSSPVLTALELMRTFVNFFPPTNVKPPSHRLFKSFSHTLVGRSGLGAGK